jgi:hypothetical protein
MIAPKPKTESVRSTAGATGGQTKMHRQQAAGPARPGHSGKNQSVAPGQKRASGGPFGRPVFRFRRQLKPGALAMSNSLNKTCRIMGRI